MTEREILDLLLEKASGIDAKVEKLDAKMESLVRGNRTFFLIVPEIYSKAMNFNRVSALSTL